MIDTIVIKLLQAFPNSFINDRGEFIAHCEANAYFNLVDCKGEFEVKCKVLEWLSRDAYKSRPFGNKRKNELFHQFMLNGINKFLDTNFTEEDIALIYQELGNQTNRRLTNIFISPEEIKRALELLDAKEQGLLIKLPDIKLYKTLYWIWGDEIMPVKFMSINGGCIDKGRYHVTCKMRTKKDRTFTHGKKKFTYKAGDKRLFYVDDIGKTIFFTRKAAEEALKGGVSK